MPWSIHIEGMHNILQGHDLAHFPGDVTFTPFRTHLLEVIGAMDIQCMTVGRQTSSLGIWRRFCQPLRPRDGIEPITGLPRSFMDLLAGTGIDSSEQSFWNWPGEPGNFLQCYLWEAYRLAAILNIRQIERNRIASSDPQSPPAWQPRMPCPLDSRVLVNRILANVDALRLGCAERPDEDPLIRNSTLYPLIIAGQEVQILHDHAHWQEVIRECSLDLHQGGILFEILEEMWQENKEKPDIHERARARNVEIGLL